MFRYFSPRVGFATQLAVTIFVLWFAVPTDTTHRFSPPTFYNRYTTETATPSLARPYSSRFNTMRYFALLATTFAATVGTSFGKTNAYIRGVIQGRNVGCTPTMLVDATSLT